MPSSSIAAFQQQGGKKESTEDPARHPVRQHHHFCVPRRAVGRRRLFLVDFDELKWRSHSSDAAFDPRGRSHLAVRSVAPLPTADPVPGFENVLPIEASPDLPPHVGEGFLTHEQAEMSARRDGLVDRAAPSVDQLSDREHLFARDDIVVSGGEQK